MYIIETTGISWCFYMRFSVCNIAWNGQSCSKTMHRMFQTVLGGQGTVSGDFVLIIRPIKLLWWIWGVYTVMKCLFLMCRCRVVRSIDFLLMLITFRRRLKFIGWDYVYIFFGISKFLLIIATWVTRCIWC